MMKRKEDRKLIICTAILVIITLMIIAGLLYLLFSGGASKLQQLASVKDQSSCLPEPCPQVEPLPEPQEPTETDPPEIHTEPVIDEPTTPDPEPEDLTVYDTESNDSLYKIVNPFKSIDPSYVPDSLAYPEVPMYLQQTLRLDAAEALEDMFAAAETNGIHLYLVSGYRSYERQTELWNMYVSLYGEEYARRIDDYPGGSEHQIGLSVDLGTTDHVCELDTCFGETEASAWLRKHAWEYGYIERYPEGKENVTGIMYSPWNYRYIGKETAEKLFHANQAIEEFFLTE